MRAKFDDANKQLTTSLEKQVDIASEKDASSWLSTIHVQKRSYAIHKQAFIDTIYFCNGRRTANLPSNCVCGKSFSVAHSLSYSFGDFPTIPHTDLCNVTADILSY